MDKGEFTHRALNAADKLYHVACAYLRGESDREDAVQEALLRAWQKRKSLRNEAYFETWLIRILIHVCVDMAKRQKRMLPTDSLPEHPETPNETENLALREMLDHLPPEWRVLAMLCWVDGYEQKEAAKMLRLPLGTVKSRLSRARKQLKTMLQEEDAKQ